MNCRFTDLRHKEVISACDGTRIGFIDDVIVDTKCATVVSIVIFGRPGFFSLVGKCQDYIIPWEKIDLIGEDTVIISCQTPKPVKNPVLGLNFEFFQIFALRQNNLRNIR